MNKFLLWILFFTAVILPQEREYFKDFIKVGGDVFTAPLHFERNDLLKLGVTALAITGSSFIDEPLNEFTLNNKSKTADVIFSMDRYFFEMSAVVLTIFDIYAFSSNNSVNKHHATQLTEAILYSTLVNQLFKSLIGRSRPYVGEGYFVFNPLNINYSTTSFPSGHSTLAFAWAHTLASQTNSKAAKITYYTLASTMAIARIYNNQHWLSDVVFGSALGFFIADFVAGHPTNRSYEPEPIQDFQFSFNIVL